MVGSQGAQQRGPLGSQEFRRMVQPVETIKKTTPRIHYLDSKENTDSTNLRERNSEQISKESKYRG